MIRQLQANNKQIAYTTGQRVVRILLTFVFSPFWFEPPP